MSASELTTNHTVLDQYALHCEQTSIKQLPAHIANEVIGHPVAVGMLLGLDGHVDQALFEAIHAARAFPNPNNPSVTEQVMTALAYSQEYAVKQIRFPKLHQMLGRTVIDKTVYIPKR